MTGIFILSECLARTLRQAETVNSGSAEPDRVNTCEGNKSNPLPVAQFFLVGLPAHFHYSRSAPDKQSSLMILKGIAMSSSNTPPSRREQRALAQDFINRLQGESFPNSRRIYLQGSRADIQVPMREIQLSPSLIGGHKTTQRYEENEAIPVYDTAGPYGDPEVEIDVRVGLRRLRSQWIEQREDSEALEGLSSRYSGERRADDGLDEVRFAPNHIARRAKAGRCVTQLHYARAGVITPEMEFIALRENMGRERIRGEVLLQQHAGQSFGAHLPEDITPEFVRREVAEGRAIIPANINHPES